MFQYSYNIQLFNLANKYLYFPKKTYQMFDDDLFLKALAEMSNYHFKEKEWLINNFELYKLTLIWPPDLPPINRCGLIKGTLREKFNSIYKEILNDYEYKLKNDDRTLILKDKHFWL